MNYGFMNLERAMEIYCGGPGSGPRPGQDRVGEQRRVGERRVTRRPLDPWMKNGPHRREGDRRGKRRLSAEMGTIAPAEDLRVTKTGKKFHKPKAEL